MQVFGRYLIKSCMFTWNQVNLKESSVAETPLICNAAVASASMTIAPPACCKKKTDISSEGEKKLKAYFIPNLFPSYYCNIGNFLESPFHFDQFKLM